MGLYQYCQLLEKLKKFIYILLKSQDVLVLILNIFYGIFYLGMDPGPLPDDLLLKKLLRPLRIPGQSIQLLLSSILLGNLELPLDLALNRIFILSLSLLSLPENIPELASQRPIYSLFDPSLRLLRMTLLRLTDIFLHHLQFILHKVLIALVFSDQLGNFLRNRVLLGLRLLVIYHVEG